MKLRGKVENEAAGDVTGTLVRAAEKASELNAQYALVILYNTRDGDQVRTYDISTLATENMTVETANWLCDKVKDWLIAEGGEGAD